MAALIPFLKYLNPVRQFFALLTIAFICLSVVSFLSVLSAPLFGLQLADLSSLNGRLDEPSVLAYMKFSQVLSATGLFIVPPFVFMLLRGERPLQALKINQAPPAVLAMAAMLLMLVQIPLINATAMMNESIRFPEGLVWLENMLRGMETAAGQITEAFLKMDGPEDFLLMLFIMAVLPAAGEELLFRSTLQPLLARMFRNHHAGIWLTAFLFSFIHFQFFGFIPRFLIGAFLGYLFHYTGNTWIPAAAHFANNGLAVTGTWMLDRGYIRFSPDELGTPVECLIALLLFGAGMFWFIRVSRQRSGAVV